MNFVDKCVLAGLTVALGVAASSLWNLDKLPRRGWNSEVMTRYGTSRLDGQRCVVESIRGNRAKVFWPSPSGGLLEQTIPLDSIVIDSDEKIKTKK